MDRHDPFAPPGARVADPADAADAAMRQRIRIVAFLVVFATALQAVITRRNVAVAWRLAQAGALMPGEFFAMALAFALLPIGVLLATSRWTVVARVVNAAAATFALAAWILLPPAVASMRATTVTFRGACAFWLILAILGLISARARQAQAKTKSGH